VSQSALLNQHYAADPTFCTLYMVNQWITTNSTYKVMWVFVVTLGSAGFMCASAHTVLTMTLVMIHVQDVLYAVAYS
jgi:hypothetical protein